MLFLMILNVLLIDVIFLVLKIVILRYSNSLDHKCFSFIFVIWQSPSKLSRV